MEFGIKKINKMRTTNNASTGIGGECPSKGLNLTPDANWFDKLLMEIVKYYMTKRGFTASFYKSSANRMYINTNSKLSANSPSDKLFVCGNIRN